MQPLNVAQKLIISFYGDNPRSPINCRAARANQPTPQRFHRNVANVTVGDEEIRMTRGERKRLFRQMRNKIILNQQADPDSIPSKYLSSSARQARALRQAEAAAALAANESAPAKPKRSHKKKAAA